MANKKRKIVECLKCKRNITKIQYKIQCAGTCNAWFHKDCSGLDNDEFTAYELCQTPQKWTCVKCTMIDGRRAAADCPTRHSIPGRRSSIGMHETRRSVNKHTAVANEDQDGFETLFDHPNPSNADMMRAMKKMYEELKHSVTFNGSMMEQMKENIQSLATENAQLKKEEQLLKTRIGALEKEIIHIKAHLPGKPNDRNKNVVIVGLKGDKNTEVDVFKTFSALDVNVSRDDVEIKVMPSKNSLKPVVITFVDEKLRSTVLKQRKSIQLDTEKCQIGAETKRKIYVNPDLSKHTRELLLKAKELKSIGFKYVWCKEDETVLVRKGDRDPVIRIITSAQVDSIKSDHLTQDILV